MGHFLQSLCVVAYIYISGVHAVAQQVRVKLATIDSPAPVTGEVSETQQAADSTKNSSSIQTVQKAGEFNFNAEKNVKTLYKTQQESGQETQRTGDRNETIIPTADERSKPEYAPLFPDLSATAVKEEPAETAVLSGETKPQQLQKINGEVPEDILSDQDAVSGQVTISPAKRKYLEEKAVLLEQEIQKQPNISGVELKAKQQELTAIRKLLAEYK
jgi:hypothetical protein